MIGRTVDDFIEIWKVKESFVFLELLMIKVCMLSKDFNCFDFFDSLIVHNEVTDFLTVFKVNFLGKVLTRHSLVF